MKRIYFTVLVCCLTICVAAQGNDEPHFIDDGILFTRSNIVVPIKPLTMLGNDSLANSVQDYYHISEELERVIIVTSWRYDNHREYETAIYNFDGILLNNTEKITGQFEIIILDDAKRILFAQHALLINASDSYLYDENGKLIKKIVHDAENRRTGHSENENYIWFVSFKMRAANKGDVLKYPSVPFVPYNHVMMFASSNGDLVKDINIESGGTVPIDINGLKIQVELPEPDIPG
ncbi:hypothetical protein [Marispirochaeta sp.]|uniref:hypothetical protein n=1 Tax=Marispirochaeta sp. TaxID=2038653 RepID=UPI0029C688A1|nr:hypothetical protein [Marispirochaeta sp.]